MIFPNAHIQKFIMLTNRHLSSVKKPQTKIGEILIVYRVLIIITEFDFGSRRMLWSSVAPSKYVHDP